MLQGTPGAATFSSSILFSGTALVPYLSFRCIPHSKVSNHTSPPSHHRFLFSPSSCALCLKAENTFVTISIVARRSLRHIEDAWSSISSITSRHIGRSDTRSNTRSNQSFIPIVFTQRLDSHRKTRSLPIRFSLRLSTTIRHQTLYYTIGNRTHSRDLRSSVHCDLDAGRIEKSGQSSCVIFVFSGRVPHLPELSARPRYTLSVSALEALPTSLFTVRLATLRTTSRLAQSCHVRDSSC